MKNRALKFNNFEQVIEGLTDPNPYLTGNPGYGEFKAAQILPHKDGHIGIISKCDQDTKMIFSTVMFHQRGGEDKIFLVDNHSNIYFESGFGPLYYGNDDHAIAFHDNETVAGVDFGSIAEQVADFKYDNEARKLNTELLDEYGEDFIDITTGTSDELYDATSQGAKVLDSYIVDYKYHEIEVNDGDWSWLVRIYPDNSYKYFETSGGMGPLSMDNDPIEDKYSIDLFEGHPFDDTYDKDDVATGSLTRFEIVDPIVKKYIAARQ